MNPNLAKAGLGQRSEITKNGLLEGKPFVYPSLFNQPALVGWNSMKQFGGDLLTERLTLAIGNAHIAG